MFNKTYYQQSSGFVFSIHQDDGVGDKIQWKKSWSTIDVALTPEPTKYSNRLKSIARGLILFVFPHITCFFFFFWTIILSSHGVMDRLFMYKTIIIFSGLFFQLYNKRIFPVREYLVTITINGSKFRIK